MRRAECLMPSVRPVTSRPVSWASGQSYHTWHWEGAAPPDPDLSVAAEQPHAVENSLELESEPCTRNLCGA